MLSQPSLHGTVGPCDRGASVLPSITIQHHHYVAFHNRYVGIRSTRPPTNQHPTTLLKCLTTGEPPSLFDMDGVTYAPGAPPSAMLGIPDQMGQFVCHSFTPLKSWIWGAHRTPTRPVDDRTSQVRDNPAGVTDFGEDREVTLFGYAHALSPVSGGSSAPPGKSRAASR